MVQAKLPDLNNYWIKYHDIGIHSLYNKNYAGVVACIYNMNALLPDDYRVEINTEKYNELSQDKLMVVCSNCNTEIVYNEIRVYETFLSTLQSMIQNARTERVWNCPKCNEVNQFARTKKIKNHHKNPFYYKVIPEPPIQKDGLTGRHAFHNKMTSWFFTSLEEIDHQLGLYRKEYEPEGERDDIIEGEEIAG